MTSFSLLCFSLLMYISAVASVEVANCTNYTVPHQLILDTRLDQAITEIESLKQSHNFTFCVDFLFDGLEAGCTVLVPVNNTVLFIDMLPSGVQIMKVAKSYPDKYRFKANTTYHVCLVSTPAEVVYYLNGKNILTSGGYKYSANPSISIRQFKIESTDEEAEYYRYYIFEMRYYARKLSADEVKAVHCNKTAAPKDLMNWNNIYWGGGTVIPMNSPKYLQPGGC